MFRGCYKGIVVDSDAYLLHVSKCIYLNSISARMVESLEQYEWSSYLAYIGKIKAPTWLVCDEVYSQLTTNHSKPEHYQHFMTNENLDKSLIKFYQQQTAGPILGNEAFINKLALIKASSEVPRHIQVMKRPTILAIISEISSMHGEDISSIVVAKRGRGKSNELRKMAMYIARKHGNYRLHEIAEAFGLRHYGGASSTIHLFMQELEKDQLLREKVAAVVKMMGIKII